MTFSEQILPSYQDVR